jgi:hypothetical protein
MHAIQIPGDPTTKAHLMCRVLRMIGVPHRIDNFVC